MQCVRCSILHNIIHLGRCAFAANNLAYQNKEVVGVALALLRDPVHQVDDPARGHRRAQPGGLTPPHHA